MLLTYATTESYKIDRANKIFNDSEVELIEYAKSYDINAKPDDKEKFFEKFMHKLANTSLGNRIASMITEAGAWRMATVDEDNMTELFNYYSVAGIDVDRDKDKDTEFRILFHIRLYKKAYKIITTYIRGSKLGASQVYVVDKKDMENGKLLVHRKRQYKLGDTIGEDETLLYQGTWKPNSVMTGRWASPIHTLPGIS